MKVATFDIETNGLYPDLDTIWCIVVKDHADSKVSTFHGSANLLAGLDYLSSFDTLIGHNCIDFDFPALRKVLGWEYKGEKIDTLIMSRTQRPNRTVPPGCNSGPNSVEAWGLRLRNHKVENNEWTTWTPLILDRCVQDTEIQYEIYHALLKEAEGEGWEPAHKLNNKLFHYLQLQTEYGWLIDKPLLEKHLSTLDRWMGRIERAIAPRLPLTTDSLETKKDGQYNWVRKPFLKNGEATSAVKQYLSDGGLAYLSGPFSRIRIRPVDIDKSGELKDYLLSTGWEPSEWNHNDDGERTSPKLSGDDPFNGVRGKIGQLIVRRVQCKQRRGILEGWQSAIRADGRISTQVGGVATTARLRHKLVVNVPSPHSGAFFAKQMRQIFIAKPGWDLVGVDSKGNQARQIAARMGDEVFIRAVLHGTKETNDDIHSLNQKIITEVVGSCTRTTAKNFFYGFCFGAQDPKIGKTIGGTTEDGKRLRAHLFTVLPGLKALIEEKTNEWRSHAKVGVSRWGKPTYRDGWVKGIDGRRIFCESEHKVLNYVIQSDEAIQMAVAYVMFHKWMEREGYVLHRDWGMLIWMHDEFQMECSPEITQRVIELACEAIAWAGRWLKIKVPHEGESQVGKNWFETH